MSGTNSGKGDAEQLNSVSNFIIFIKFNIYIILTAYNYYT